MGENIKVPKKAAKNIREEEAKKCMLRYQASKISPKMSQSVHFIKELGSGHEGGGRQI